MRAAMAANGILYGPLTTPISESSVQVLAVGLQTSGHIIFELSTSDDFPSVEKRMEQEINEFGAASTIFEDLFPATRYYVRCSLCSVGILEKQRAEAIQLQELAEEKASSGKKSKKRKEKSEVEAPPPEVIGSGVNVPTELTYDVYSNFGETLVLPSTFHGSEGGLFQLSSFMTLPSMDSIKESFSPHSSRPGTGAETPTQRERERPEGIKILEQDLILQVESREGKLSKINLPSETRKYAGDGEADLPIDECLSLSCVLGDVFRTEISKSLPEAAIEYFSSGSSSGLAGPSILRQASTIFAWNDTTKGASMDLYSEELVFKEHQHALKRWKKKYDPSVVSTRDKKKKEKEREKDKPPPPMPVLSRPEATPRFSALTKLFPLPSGEEVTRHTYRSLHVGRYIQLFVLDMREGMLGKAQAKWLINGLEGSSAAWKIILAGRPLGLEEKVDQTRRGTLSNAVTTRASPSPSFHELDHEEAKGENLNIDTNVESGKDNNNEDTVDAELETGSHSSNTLQFVFSSVMNSYLTSPEASPVASRPVSRVESRGMKNKDMNDTVLKDLGEAFAKVEIASSGGVNEIESEFLEEVAGKDTFPIDTEAESAKTNKRELTISSGIIFLTAGTPSPYIASYGENLKNHSMGECFAAEIGVGNSQWPVPLSATRNAFESVSTLSPNFLFGMNEDIDSMLSSRVSMRVFAASERGIFLRFKNTAASNEDGTDATAFEINLKLKLD